MPQQNLDLLSEVLMSDYTDIPVKVIRNKGFASLVEWKDGERFRRTIVPVDTVFTDSSQNSYVREGSLAMGIPYGIDWDHRLRDSFVIDKDAVAKRLEESGIWTKEDYNKNPNAVQQAVLGAAREILNELYGIVRAIPNQEE
jgi:hypothetical protein